MIKIDFHPSTKILKEFAWIALFGFPLMATMLMWLHLDWQPNALVYTLYALGPVTLLLRFIHPKAVQPIYIGLSLLAIPIGWVVSNILLRVIYYLLFTPMALWFRIIGKDAMNRSLQPEAETYWQDHPQNRRPASYLRLY